MGGGYAGGPSCYLAAYMLGKISEITFTVNQFTKFPKTESVKRLTLKNSGKGIFTFDTVRI